MFFLNYATVVDPLLRSVRAYTVAFSGLKAGDRALDIGCASGDQVLRYAGSGITAIGIDRNPRMLKLAEENKKKQGNSNASFQLAGAQRLPFPDGSFDCASISFVLHENGGATIDGIISEMRRVVSSKGVLLFTDFRVPLPRNPLRYIITALEFLVGRENYKSFRGYIELSGLEGILAKHHLPIEKRDDMNNRVLTVIRARNA